MRYNIKMSKLKRNLGRIIPIVLSYLLPIVSSAQVTGGAPCSTSGKICNPISANSLHEVIQKFLEGALKIGMPIVALAVIYCGFLFVKARGNSEEITKAKDALLYTLIGAGVLLGAWAIAQLVNETVKAL